MTVLQITFFRILAILAFFCAFAFTFIIPIGLLGIGIIVGWMSLDMLQRDGILLIQFIFDMDKQSSYRTITPLQFPEWAKIYLSYLPFLSIKGGILFGAVVSFFEYLTTRIVILGKHPYLSRISLAIILFGMIAMPYLITAFAQTPEQLKYWIIAIGFGVIPSILTAIYEAQHLQMIRKIPNTFYTMGKLLWNSTAKTPK